MSLDEHDPLFRELVRQCLISDSDEDYNRILIYCAKYEDHEETREIYEYALRGDIDAQQTADELLMEVFAEVKDEL